MRETSGLLTDLYELTMAAGYVEHGFDARATFELFARELPPRRGFLVSAGREQALDYIERMRFTRDEIQYLRRHPAFSRVGSRFFEFLASFRFTGEVHGVPEGSLAFAGEPILRVTAPIAEAQILETQLLSIIGFQTLIATKAARVVGAARGRPVVEFGTRRAHGIESGVLAARAAYIGGCQGTSNVHAGHRFGIPIFGTQAHSWIMAHDREEEAFRRFLDLFPEHAVLLLDTYDVHGAVEKIVALGREPAGVRLDSGDLVADSQWVRERLDAVGWHGVQVFASGDLDEDRIAELFERGARIDAFGVGTALSTSADAPAIGMVYKLVEIEERGSVRGAVKFSLAKATYPGRKQVYRFTDAGGHYSHDLIGLDNESHSDAAPVLEAVMTAGRRVSEALPLAEVRDRARAMLVRLPDRYRALDPAAPYPVRTSAALERLLEQARRRLKGEDRPAQ